MQNGIPQNTGSGFAFHTAPCVCGKCEQTSAMYIFG